MPASQCRDFSFVVKEVFFEDGSIYESGEILKELDVPSKTIYSLKEYTDTFKRELIKTGYTREIAYLPYKNESYCNVFAAL